MTISGNGKSVTKSKFSQISSYFTVPLHHNLLLKLSQKATCHNITLSHYPMITVGYWPSCRWRRRPPWLWGGTSLPRRAPSPPARRWQRGCRCSRRGPGSPERYREGFTTILIWRAMETFPQGTHFIVSKDARFPHFHPLKIQTHKLSNVPASKILRVSWWTNNSVNLEWI